MNNSIFQGRDFPFFKLGQGLYSPPAIIGVDAIKPEVRYLEGLFRGVTGKVFQPGAEEQRRYDALLDLYGVERLYQRGHQVAQPLLRRADSRHQADTLQRRSRLPPKR